MSALLFSGAVVAALALLLAAGVRGRARATNPQCTTSSEETGAKTPGACCAPAMFEEPTMKDGQ